MCEIKKLWDVQIMNFEDRLRELFGHLGIERAHMVGGYFSPSGDLPARAPDLVASMVLVCPMSVPRTMAGDVSAPFAIVTGDRGGLAESVTTLMSDAGHGRHIVLSDCAPQLWDDLARERTRELGDGILNFLASVDEQTPMQAIAPVESAGMVAELAWRVMGNGPPIILFPLGLAPSQWDPLLPELSARYTLVLISGAHVPPSASHENRIRNPGYMANVKTLLDAVGIEPGAAILEVGCGTGAVTRVLAEYTGGNNPITGFDINAFLRREAELLAEAAGFADIIEILEGDAHALPVADGSFDITLAVTMLEEVDADVAIAEMVRVTRRGGRVGAMVRSLDMAPLVSADLPEAVSAKIIAGLRAVGAAPKGSADTSLYRRFARAGLKDLKIYPCFNNSAHLLRSQLANALSRLDEDERKIFDSAAAEAGEGYFIAMPMHLAVGHKT